MIRGTLCILLLLGLSGEGRCEELTAVITQLDGIVTLKGPGVGGFPAAKMLQIVRSGVVLHLSKDGSAGVVCSNDRFVRVQGAPKWQVTFQNCAQGKKADYDLFAPRGGRFRYAQGLWAFELEARGDDDGDPLAPVVLSPRNTAIRSPRPSIRWLQVPSAVEYRIEWTGRGADAFTLDLDAQDVRCPLGICELPWRAERPDLPPGRSFFLSVAARDDIVGPWHELDSVEVRTLAAEVSEAVARRLRDLEVLGLEGGALEAARGAVLAQAGLYAEAAESCEQAIEIAPAASLKVTLADVRFAIGLHRLAHSLYREAQEDDDPAVRAAAAFGVGRIEYAQARYHEAALRFRQALDLYGEARLPEEETAARRWLKEAEARAFRGAHDESRSRRSFEPG